ncbi:MAG: substrate-binding domain-containing protein [Deltaproteobacteria bacterium]|jgi:ABC-type molybdate transport system substrate-binding protein|nr:substrate-binding domain-containing protein [Deltaproteobacteria bacterium]
MTKNALPIIPPDRADDLHHLEIAAEADLVLFMAGNQFMVMPEIISAFQARYPEIKKIFYETLPPGLELKQILARGALWQNKAFTIYPDVYSSVNQKAMQILAQQGHIRPKDEHLYLHNRLTLMVPRGNPAQITSVNDLARGDVRISQPDPENEDIAHHIVDMYCQAGGDALVRRIMEEKRAEGTTLFTLVHHRETPLRIEKKTVDVGPVWVTEAVQARTTRLAFEVIEPGGLLDQRDKINYYICRLNDALHPQNAQKFIDFILSGAAQNIYKKYGFVPHLP